MIFGKEFKERKKNHKLISNSPMPRLVAQFGSSIFNFYLETNLGTVWPRNVHKV